MSGVRSQVVDVQQLAVQGATIEESFALAAFGRLGSLIEQDAASKDRRVEARFRFSIDGGRAVARVVVEADLPLTCQRCLRPVSWRISTSTELVFVASGGGADESGAREIFETIDGRVALTDVVEEELLLALPLVALHEAPNACAADGPQDEGSEETTPSDRTQLPFAGLKDLLGRK